MATASLDVFFASNFFEHLSQKLDVESTISEVKRCLKPGGVFIALGPNVRLLPGAYWDHHVHISDRSLAELLAMNGFEITEQHAAFLLYTMSDGNQHRLILVKLYLQFRFLWKLFGKKFLVVACAED
jgi:dolichol-phosphate mannosyltransferase